MNHTRSRFDAVPGMLALAGGAIAAWGCILPWEKLSPGGSGLFDPRTRNGLEEPFDMGGFALGAGIAVALAGIVLLFIKAPTVRRVTGEVATVVALVPVLVAGYNIATMDEKFDEVFRVSLEEATGQALTDQAVDLARAELERIGIEVSLQYGIYLTLVGGLIGLAGTLLALRPRRPRGAPVTSGFEPPAPPPPRPEASGPV